VKHRVTILHDRVGLVRFHKKRVGTLYSELVFLHPVGSTGHVVHFGVRAVKHRGKKFMLSWARYGFDKKLTGTHFSELVFLYPVGYVGHVVHSVRLGIETSLHYFSCLGGTGVVSIKSAQRHVTLNLCVCIQGELRVT
jgi:hypothetical protein